MNFDKTFLKYLHTQFNDNSLSHKKELYMVSESVEFVSDYFDNTFGVVLEKSDARIKNFRKFCKTIHKMRINRKQEGSVVINVQTMDSFKFLDSAIMNVMQRIESGAIKITDENGKEISKIVIASFGKDSSGKETSSAWTGSVQKFIDIIHDAPSKEESAMEGTNKFYLRNLPETIVKNKKDVEYIIIGIIIESDDSFYDTAGISIIGIPEEREEEIANAAVLKMFGYDE